MSGISTISVEVSITVVLRRQEAEHGDVVLRHESLARTRSQSLRVPISEAPALRFMIGQAHSSDVAVIFRKSSF